jgi:hypothetical protein
MLTGFPVAVLAGGTPDPCLDAGSNLKISRDAEVQGARGAGEPRNDDLPHADTSSDPRLATCAFSVLVAVLLSPDQADSSHTSWPLIAKLSTLKGM